MPKTTFERDRQARWWLVGLLIGWLTALPPGAVRGEPLVPSQEVAAPVLAAQDGTVEGDPSGIERGEGALPFYEARWFYVLVGLGLVLLGTFGYRRLARRLEAKARREARIEQQRELDAVKARAGVSHEFRALLAHIIGPLEALHHGRYGPLAADAVERVAQALDAARRLSQLVDPRPGWDRFELEPEARPAPEGEDRTMVLLADDNADLRARVRSYLEPAYRVVEAPDGRQALEKARHLLPDLVIADGKMPVMDGYALCRAIKQERELEFIPVLLLKAEEDNGIEEPKPCAEDYLEKPIDVPELGARVAKLIAAQQHLRGWLRRNTTPLHAGEIDVTSSDAVFLARVRAVVEAHLAEEDFSVELLAAAVGLSRMHLYRRLRALLQEAPAEMIRSMRLERAARLLARRAGTVGEIAYGVGFKSVAHFSTSFRNKYGFSPSAYMARFPHRAAD